MNWLARPGSCVASRLNRWNTVWPESLARVGAIRFARRYHRFEEAIRFYRDVVGLPLIETFEGSYGTNGAIFGLPDSSLTFEVVQSREPVDVDPHEQLCLYFPDAEMGRSSQASARQFILSPSSYEAAEIDRLIPQRKPGARSLLDVAFPPLVLLFSGWLTAALPTGGRTPHTRS